MCSPVTKFTQCLQKVTVAERNRWKSYYYYYLGFILRCCTNTSFSIKAVVSCVLCIRHSEIKPQIPCTISALLLWVTHTNTHTQHWTTTSLNLPTHVTHIGKTEHMPMHRSFEISWISNSIAVALPYLLDHSWAKRPHEGGAGMKY